MRSESFPRFKCLPAFLASKSSILIDLQIFAIINKATRLRLIRINFGVGQHMSLQ